MASLTYMQLLRDNRPFRRLWIGQVISELGNWFNFIAGLGLVRAVTGAQPEATAIMLVLRMAPFALFAPFAGACVDRWSRRRVMIVTDVLRSVTALGFLLVKRPEDLWIAYACTILLTLFGTFFEAAKNASMPNVTGHDGLLAGNALMFSSRFLLMSFGAALGGWSTAHFGYQASFIINSVSFLVSAYSVSLISESETRSAVQPQEGVTEETQKRASFWMDLREGWAYIVRHPLVAAIIGVNILWATGGGAINLITDRMGGVVFATRGGWQPDANVSLLYAAAGAGLFIGMILVRRVGTHIEMHQVTGQFIGWTLVAHGALYAVMGLMPNIWLASVALLLSRVLLGVEFAVQETLLMRMLPDNLRGRVSTTDRALEILVTSISTLIAARSLRIIEPRTLTVISGILSASPGIMWLILFARERLHIPSSFTSRPEEETEDEEAALVTTG